MLLKTLLVLLPALAYASISVSIKAATDEKDAKVDLLGSNVEIIPDNERNAWRLNDYQLKDAANAYSGGRPDDAYLHGPTPWGNLYERYGWPEVQRTLHAINGRTLGIRTEPVIVNKQDFINNSNVTAKYQAGITQSVEETVSSSWSKGGQLQIGQEISYKVEFGVGEVGGTSSISYTSSWGEETSKSKSVTIGSSSGVEVELAPGQAVTATLSATRGTMDVKVDYIATLNGYTACNYSGRYKGHYFWAYDINACLRATGSPTTIDSTETLKIGFYADAKVVVTDKLTSQTIYEGTFPVL